MKCFSDALAFGQIFKSLAPCAIADKQKFDLWILPDEFRRDGKQIVMAFELEQPRNFADDEIVRRNSQFSPKSRSFFAFRNGSSAKPLKILVYCSGLPMPAARYWFFIASATTIKMSGERAAYFSAVRKMKLAGRFEISQTMGRG